MQSLQAAEGQIPWKGLKLIQAIYQRYQHLAAEGQIPWKGLKLQLDAIHPDGAGV